MEIDAYDNPDAERLLAAREQRLGGQLRQRRELITNGVGAVAFLATAVALAGLAPWQRSLSATNLALVLIVWALVERVKFPVASGWTYPTMLAFVPALFLLPTPVVPLVAMAAAAFRALPGLIRGRLSLKLLPTCVADAWFTIGPVLVVVLGHAQRFSWTHWPVYVAALVAQVLFDMATTLTWTWVGEGISPRVELPLLSWLYLVDAALAPLGLLIAAVAVQRPGLVLVALSPTAMLCLFARERRQRLGQTQALSTAYRGTALLLGDVVEADDQYTGSHSREVVELSLAVADALRLDTAARQDLEFAALLHDVGKIRIAKEIINKRGALDDVEWAIIRGHTIEGEKMLKQVGGTLSSVGRIVRWTHERFDGGGYPDGLAGSAIPIESRIVAVCDSYSAMSTDRPYRRALSLEQTVAELHRCSGTQFDPLVVEALLGVLGAAGAANPARAVAMAGPEAALAAGVSGSGLRVAGAAGAGDLIALGR